MSTNQVINPYEYFMDFNQGRPIFNGQIFVGLVGTDPEVQENQKDVTFSDACDCPEETVIMQPIRTSSGGVPIYNGSPIRLFVDGAYSLKVNDRNGVQVYYSPDVTKGVPLTIDDAGPELDTFPLNSDLRVDTIALLRLTDPSANLQNIYLNGHTSEGIGGGEFYYDEGDTDSADNNGTVIVTSGGKRWKRCLADFVTLEMFGGIPDFNTATKAGADNQPALKAAQDFCEDTGLKVILSGRFGVASSTVQKAICIEGSATGGSGLYALLNNHRVLTWDPLLTGGSCILKNFTISGFAETDPTLGGDDSVLAEISEFDNFLADNLELSYGRQMALKSRATISSARFCHVHHIHRDGINFSDAKVRHVNNCTMEFVADDPIACHSNATNYKTETVITDNILFNTLGIKCLSSNFTISNNRGNMIFGYGIQYGKASGYAEGDIDVKCSSITNNSFMNIINLSKLGLGDLGAGIYSKPIFKENSNGFYPNDYDNISNNFVDPLITAEVYGDSVAHIGSFSVVISGNTISQIWTGGSLISDYGSGEAWTTAGFKDIALTGTLGINGNKVDAYRFDNVAENIGCCMGATYGTTTGVNLLNIKRMKNISISLGQMSRISKAAISIAKDTSISTLNCENSIFSGGVVDMDPMFEQPDREYIGGEPTGAWTNTGSSNCIGISALSVVGIIWSGTCIRNMQKVGAFSGGGVIIPSLSGLNIFLGDGTGVGVVNAEYDQNLIFTDSDPRSAGYGDILQGNLVPRSGLPTAGSYFAGQTIRNNNLAAQLGGSTYTGLIRLTTGTSNTLGTDWGYIPFT